LGGANTDKDGVISVRSKTINIGTASVNHADTDDIFDKFNIKLRKIDNFINENVSFIKIDVEGYELEVLQGLQDSLKKYSPIVSFEQHSQDFFNDLDTQALTSSSISYLRQQGYKYFFEIESSKDWRWNTDISNKILNKIVHSIESILFGVPMKLIYKLKPIKEFNKRTYDLIISSKNNL